MKNSKEAVGQEIINSMITEEKVPEFYIPIDREISQFTQHLQTHHRTILSAKFGDGKSYFLDRLQKDKKVAANYKFINVYPINY